MPNWAKVAIGTVTTAIAVTFATGGAIIPLLLGVATSTLLSAAIGYVTGGSEEALNEAANGLMWGGIGSFAVSCIGAIKTVSDYRKTVDTYASLRKRYKGSGIEAHHIIEKRLVDGSNWNKLTQMLYTKEIGY